MLPRVKLDLSLSAAELTACLVDIESVSGNEQQLADLIASALAELPHLSLHRDGNALVARTALGRPERVAIAGHIDTVPVADNLPSRRDGRELWGLGSCDMKSGVAVQLKLAASLPDPARDITFVFYDCEEVEAERNGLLRLARNSPELLQADFAVLMEPTDGVVEGGCQGSMKVEVRTAGQRAHSARSWMGRNAIHEAAAILNVLRRYEARQPVVDGLTFHEGLNAVGISGGVAGNVIPDECVVTVNYRPGLDRPAAASFASAMGGTPRAKYGWTDVARFDMLGIPAVNYGPGDPMLAHSRQEHVDLAQIGQVEDRMRAWLTA
jgi:succinyl-diaminopimelate desuccinylase